MGKDGRDPQRAAGLLQAQCLPQLRCLLLYGTASTMQIMAEALGLMLPGTALMPATAPELKQAAYDAGVQVMKLVAEGIKPRTSSP